MRRSVVLGLGSYLPERIVPNTEFAKTLDTNDAWIIERTGIRERHFAADDEYTSDLGAKAALNALASAKLTPDDIDLIVLGTTTPDDTMPSTATRIQHKLGIIKGSALDVNAACSGFVYAITVADSLLKSGVGNRALVIGAETYSRILNFEDRTTCILFGDGAGALVLEAQDEAKAGDRGILYTKLHSDGQYGGLLATTGGVSKTKTAGTLFMHGKEIFRHAVAKMSDCVDAGMQSLGLSANQIDVFAPHQANVRILQGVGQNSGFPPIRSFPRWKSTQIPPRRPFPWRCVRRNAWESLNPANLSLYLL